MVELVHRDEPIVEGFRPELLHGETERGMGADQRLVAAFEKRFHGACKIKVASGGRVRRMECA